MARKKEKDSGMTVQEAGKKGGKTTSHRYGKEFYEEIGRKGGERTKAEHGPGFYEKIGRAGGKARNEQRQK